jgi:MGT family glycosyltransferase
MGKAVALIYPTQGHIAPALGVISELVARGESVVFYGTGRSRQKIEKTGAQFRFYGHGHDEFSPTPPTDGLLTDMSRLLALTERLLPKLLADLRAATPGYLLIDTKSLWGRLVGQILKIPAITLSVVFAIQAESIGVPDLARFLYNGASGEKLLRGLQEFSRYAAASQQIDRRYGTVGPGIIEYLGNPQPLNIIFTSREFQLQGNAFDDRYQFVGPSIPPERDGAGGFPMDWLKPDVPLIYIALGTTFNRAPEFYRKCLLAFADMPVQVVLSTGLGGVEDLGRAPANFQIREFVPQVPLLRQARVFVTHGGMNSANEALYCGVPMVVIPQAGDQHLVASRIAELGAGVTIPPNAVSVAGLREAVTTVLACSDFRQRANELAVSMKEAGGYQRAASLVLNHSALHARREIEALRRAPETICGQFAEPSTGSRIPR